MGAVSRYALSPEQRLRAFAAVDRFTPQPPLDDDGRAVILGAIAGVLNDQERDDLRAALERRPLVKHGLPPRDLTLILEQLRQLRPKRRREPLT